MYFLLRHHLNVRYEMKRACSVCAETEYGFLRDVFRGPKCQSHQTKRLATRLRHFGPRAYIAVQISPLMFGMK